MADYSGGSHATRTRSSNSTDVRDSGVASGDSVSSRGRSFSFLRRSSSKEAVARSSSQGRKLLRRKKSQRDGAGLPAVSKEVPRLPSYTTLPTISGPFPYIPNPPDSPSARQQQHSPKTFGYNPRAFYQNRPMDGPASGSRGVPVPPIPEGSRPGTAQTATQGFDPYARTESMTHRGRYSYASSMVATLDSPRRVRRRKDPTPFNVLVVGAKSCGKSSFIEFLRTALAAQIKRRPMTPSPPPAETQDTSGSFTSHYLETELEGERVGITLHDSKGLERHLVDLQLREISSFLESKFQETFNEEQKVMRATGVRDTHIHCVFLVLDPSRLDQNIAVSTPKAGIADTMYASKPRIIGGLDEDLDCEIIRALQGKTTVIPVISKADTITTAHMAYLKRTVWDSLKKIKFDPLEALNLDTDADSDEDAIDDFDESKEDEYEDEETRAKKPNGGDALTPPDAQVPRHDKIRLSHMSMNVDLPDLPMSIISPDVYDPGVVGRRFPWGFADPYDADHCDFVRLKETVFSEWRAELRVASREKWYEGWRTNRLKTRGAGSPVIRNVASATYHTTPRNVSAAAAYGSIASRNASTPQPPAQARVVSMSEIGVAIGDDAQHSNGYAK